ncbi:Ubiquinone/menaquinone biosynthesis C-methyltransferase UbiE [Ensifer adhaerens]|nr:Ubiquinone/menaquinone biosynthesis C-methyltransferase UbiE [Ensifer adhaerens]
MSVGILQRSRTSTEDGRIIITGTGRAGTTLLVQYFTALGFDTGFSMNGVFKEIDSFSHAGLERKLVDETNPYVIKSPEFADHLMDVLKEGRMKIFSAIIPMRNLFDAAASRRRVFKAGVEWGSLWKTKDPNKQEDMLAMQFYKAMYPLVKYGVPTYFLDFPRFAEDFDYFFRTLRPLTDAHGVTRAEAKAAYTRVVDKSKIHSFRALFSSSGKSKRGIEIVQNNMPVTSDNTAFSNPNILLPHVLREKDFVDLGAAVESRYAGIFSPREEVSVVPLGVTAQFLENPEDFHHAATDTEHAQWLISTVLERISHVPENSLVLDVGSGSGNTAFALLRTLKDPVILATDISRPLLRSLLTTAKTVKNGSSIVPVCIDLNKPSFRDNRFDLIVGRAILHHLFEPDILIKNLYASMKPGSSMVFFEPYECGYAFFGMLLEMIIETANRMPGVSDEIITFLRGTSLSYQKCEPKPVEEYANLDDKWNFSRSYFERVADDLGAHLRIYPMYKSAHPYSGELAFRLKAGAGAEREALPQWAWDLIEKWESRLSQDALDEMAYAVSIVFTKPTN